MHVGVMVTGYNHNDWSRLMAEDYSTPPAKPDWQCMEDPLYMGELVEPLGFDSIWATEHYGSAYSMQPNPLQYLAYWAGRTSRIDVGTAVVVAPWWNPVRLASELSMLDILLKGRRIHLGVGRGVTPHEYGSLGYPQGESHKYFHEVVAAIRAADGAQRFTYDGEVYKIPPTTIRPQARHFGDLTTNIKAAFRTKTSMVMAAEAGLGQMFVSDESMEEMTQRVREFNEIRAKHGLAPDQPTTLLWMYCAPTEKEAQEGWKYLEAQSYAARNHYFEWNNPGTAGIKGMEEYQDKEKRQADIDAAVHGQIERRRQYLPIGTPDQVLETIQRVQKAISNDKLILHVQYGGMTTDVAEKSMRLFAREVLPALQAMDTPINPASLGVPAST